MSKVRGTRRIVRDAERRDEVTEPEFKLRNLIVVRESNASDHLLFEDMVYKTMTEFLRELPHIEPLAALGVKPFNVPDDFSAVVERWRGTRSATFVVGDTIIFYHQGSAAKVCDGEEINHFTNLLLSLVRTHPIRTLFAFSVNRLVRDDENAMRLGAELLQRHVVVRTREETIDFHRPMGPAQWAIAAHFAAAERRSIVERNRLGRVAAARRKQWPNGTDRVPLGFRLEGKTIVPVAEERERVAKVLTAMADPDLTTKQFVKLLGGIGVERPSLDRILGPGKTLKDVKHPKDIRASFERYLTLYETGVYEVPLPNPSPGVQMFGGLPVHRSDPDDAGYIVLRYEFGLPDGGWADASVFDGIRRRNEADNAYRNGTRARRPLSGRPAYTRDGETYQFDTCTLNGYRLRRAHFVSTKECKPSQADMDTIATVSAGELHRAVARGIVTVISGATGADGILALGAMTVRVDRQTRLEHSIAFRETRAANARRAMLEATDELTRAAFLAEAEREAREATDLRELDATSAVTPSAPEALHVDAGPLLRGLALLERTDAVLDGALCAAIETVIPKLELFPINRTDKIGWSAIARIQTTDGMLLELGPIHGEVMTRRRRATPGKRVDLAWKMLLAFSEGASVGATAAEAGSLPEYGYKLLRNELMRLGFPVTSAMHLRSTPVPELRELAARSAIAGIVPAVGKKNDAALAKLLAEHGVVPDGCDTRWAIAALRRYTEPLPSGPWGWSNSNRIGQELIDHVVGIGGSITVAELMERYAGEDVSRARVMQRAFGSQTCPPVLQCVEPWPTQRGRAEPDAVLRLVPCPHCPGNATVHLRAAEIPGALLCDACRHNPWEPYPYPAGYFAVPRGTHYVNPMTVQAAADPKPSLLNTTNRRVVTPGEEQQVIADYKGGLALTGAAGLLEKHNIPFSRLYRIIDAAGVARRRPIRKRGKAE